MPAKTASAKSTLGSFGSSTFLLRLDPQVNVNEAIKAYKNDPNVIFVEPNYRGSLAYVPSDPLYPQTRNNLELIGMEEAWDAQQGADSSVKVAVVDSGMDATHPDLSGALDSADSYNFVDDNASVFDASGHGTRVAGIIGATGNNAEGIAGIAFGCQIMSLDVADTSGTITTARVASAINWAVAHGAQVVNLSLDFNADSQILSEACDAASSAGVLLVAAAGNENQGDCARLSGFIPFGFGRGRGLGGWGDPCPVVQLRRHGRQTGRSGGSGRRRLLDDSRRAI